MKFSKKEREKIYDNNKKSSVGVDIICPICGKHFIKIQYSQAFCSNECKVKYHNINQKGKRKSYYHKYNKEHPQRLERGFTKGYINGNVSNGIKEKQNGNIYYDSLGRPHSRDFYNPTMTDMIDYKLHCEWHDDDWCEESEY